MAYPEGRVFRPKDEKTNQLIEGLMKVRYAEKSIKSLSWTHYVEFLLNKDMMEINARFQSRSSQR